MYANGSDAFYSSFFTFDSLSVYPFFFVGFYLSPLATISCVYIWLYKLDFPYR